MVYILGLVTALGNWDLRIEIYDIYEYIFV